MTPVSRTTAAGRAYLNLKAKARAESRLTDELIQLYVLEGFLTRLVMSEHSDRLVLKGGVLLAAFGTRRPRRPAVCRVRGTIGALNATKVALGA